MAKKSLYYQVKFMSKMENIIDEAPAEELPAAEEVPAAAEVPVTEALPVQEESALPVETAEEAAV
jgi:hypothetical protein